MLMLWQSAWENQRKAMDNQLAKFLASWIKVHRPLDPSHTSSATEGHVSPMASRLTSGCGQQKGVETARDSGSEEEEDFIQDLQLDSEYMGSE